MSKVLPKIESYVAHPQSVWFEEHWRPLFDKQKAELDAANEEIERLKAELVAVAIQFSAPVRPNTDFTITEIGLDGSETILVSPLKKTKNEELQNQVAELKKENERLEINYKATNELFVKAQREITTLRNALGKAHETLIKYSYEDAHGFSAREAIAELKPLIQETK